MSLHSLSACGILIERTKKNRLAIARVARRIGPWMRRRTEQDDYLIALSFAMSIHDTSWARRLFEDSGCVAGKDFVQFTGDALIGDIPNWLLVLDQGPKDYWLGLRPETWDRMEPSVREYWEEMRNETHRIYRHISEPANTQA
jgi:hypothetical protein